MNLMRAFWTLVSGALFGFGLAYSGMINPHTVIAFLTFEDLGLLIVLCTAVAVNLIVFQLAPRVRPAPLTGGTFEKRPFALNRSVIVGGVLFGLGWGICGICPAPVFAGLGTGNLQMLVVGIMALLGAGVHGWWANRGGNAA